MQSQHNLIWIDPSPGQFPQYARANYSESLLASVSMAGQTVRSRGLSVLIPSHDEYVLYCSGTVVTLELDETYTRFQATAHENISAETLEPLEVEFDEFIPSNFTGGKIPEINDDWCIMACPRSMTRRTPRIGLGFIGPKTSSLLLHAPFPIFIPGGAFKPWTKIAAFFGGPHRGTNAVRVADTIARRANTTLEILTHLGDANRSECAHILNELRRLGGWPRAPTRLAHV